MYCKNCGAKLIDGSPFCPNCGTKAGESGAVGIAGAAYTVDSSESAQNFASFKKMSAKNTAANRTTADNTSTGPAYAENAGAEKPKSKSILKIFIIAALVIALAAVGGVFGYRALVKQKISEEVNSYMALVKSGVDDETADQIFKQVVPELVGDETIASFLTENIDGSDVMDIYGSMMLAFDYEVGTPVRVGTNHYQVPVTVQNLNNYVVFSNVISVVKERYSGGIFSSISQFFSDLGSDYSETLAEIIADSAQEVYETNNSDYYVQGTYTLDIQKVNGTWCVTNDYTDLIMGCLGLSE